MDYKLMNWLELVDFYGVVDVAGEIGVQGELLDGLVLGEGEVYVLGVYVEAHYCGVLWLAFSYNANRSYLDLSDKRHHQQDLTITIRPHKFLLIKSRVKIFKNRLATTSDLLIKTGDFVDINSAEEIVGVLDPDVVFTAAVRAMLVLHWFIIRVGSLKMI